MPWSAVLALVTGGLGALPLVFTTAVAWAYVADPDSGPVLVVVLLALTVAQFTGVLLLRDRRSWRVLVGTSLAIVVVVPAAAVATAAGSGEPLAETISGLAVLLAGPVLTAVLASSSGARRWGRRPSRLPADVQPFPGRRP